MNKNELISKISEASEMQKKDVELFLCTFVSTIKETLVQGEKIQIAGFGNFDISYRKARKGVNPSTGESIDIKASKSPVFKAGKQLKEAVNQ